MHAAFLMMTTAWLAADPAPAAAPAAPAPAASACCGGSCGSGCNTCCEPCCEKEHFLKKCFKRFHHKNDCGCCEAAPCCGTACVTAASCCDPCNTCCEKEHFLKRCFKRFHHNDCCEPCCQPTCCQPTCCQPTCCKPACAPTCCQPSCCQPCCEKEHFLKRCLNKLHHKNDCCCNPCDTCNSCGAPAMAPAKPEPIGPPKDPKKMPEGAAVVPAPDAGAAAPRVAPLEGPKTAVTAEVPF